MSKPPTAEPEENAYVDLPLFEIEEIERELKKVADPDLRQAIRRARIAHLTRIIQYSEVRKSK